MVTDMDALASAAVQDVRDDMTVGLGTGRAATRAIHALARRATEERLKLHCVATSRASEELARALGLLIRDMRAVERVDYLSDGADEVDESLRMLKRRGGAMTREKIVAQASARRVYLIQSRKRVRHLGETVALPIEAMSFGLTAVRGALRVLGLDGAIRLNADGTTYETDNGNPIIDSPLPRGVDVTQLGAALDGIAGIVGHGLFLSEADVVLVEDNGGRVSRHARVTRT
jgi:ribose 5-phosphate isomerase A